VIVQGDPNFREYLEAKFFVDGESLNRRTYTAFVTLLSRMENPFLLDVGTGTASMIRRVIESSPSPRMVLYGVDANRDLLDAGRRQVAELFDDHDFAIKSGDQITTATKGDQVIEVHLVAGDLFDPKLQSSLRKLPFNVVTTHAYMGGVPLEPALALFGEILPKGGLFYSTINYDGTTELLPFFDDRGFEQELLEVYNRSMDGDKTVRRRVEGPPSKNGNGSTTGGSRTGSVLYDRVARSGFSVSGFGSSDWTVFPWHGRYSSQEEIFLNTLLLTMYEEGLRHPHLDRYTLSTWYAERSQSVEERKLSLITHQTDILAVRA